MSQSDYIKYKKITNKLSESARKQPPVFDSSDYSSYKQYVIENIVPNSKLTYRKLIDNNSQLVFDMEKKKADTVNMNTDKSKCPTFLLCKNTNLRDNRVSLLGTYYTPTPQPLNWKQSNKLHNIKDISNCICK
jgi:hypothetical protein